MATIDSTPAPASADKTPDALTLIVYSREQCHLCHDMIAALHALQGRLSFRLEIVDVDTDGSADLRSRYGERVPVLAAAGQEICHYHLDLTALARIFPQIASGAS